MNEPCQYCPMRRSTPEGHRHLIGTAAGLIAKSKGFPCHDKHPTQHALVGVLNGHDKYEHTDCVGYKMFIANKKNPGRFPAVVDSCHQIEEAFVGNVAITE